MTGVQTCALPISGVIELENIQMNKGNDFIQLSGKIEENGNVFLDRLQATYEGHYLALPSPLNFILKDESIIVKPFVLHVDDGVIEGYFHKKKLLDGRFKLSNIESSLISPFIQDNRFKISGMIFGELGVHESIEKYISFNSRYFRYQWPSFPIVPSIDQNRSAPSPTAWPGLLGA